MNDYVNHPNQLYYKGQHVLSTFAGENCKFGQADFNSGWNYAIRNGAFDNVRYMLFHPEVVIPDLLVVRLHSFPHSSSTRPRLAVLPQ